MVRKPAARWIALLVALVVAAACAPVKPWQRERLLHPAMLPSARMGDGYHLHVRAVREAALAGGLGTGAGVGCGCD